MVADLESMKILVGTTPVKLPYTGRVTPMLQNLGPGSVYFDNSPNVSADTGIQMQAGAVYEFPRDLGGGGGMIWLIADQADTDVRVLKVG